MQRRLLVICLGGGIAHAQNSVEVDAPFEFNTGSGRCRRRGCSDRRWRARHGRGTLRAIRRQSWARRLSIDYDNIVIALRESTGQEMKAICAGHIGVTMIGFWDEMIIEKAEVSTNDQVIDQCVHAIDSRSRGPLLDTGCPPRNTRNWAILRISLIDGLAIDVVASEFSTVRARHTVSRYS